MKMSESFLHQTYQSKKEIVLYLVAFSPKKKWQDSSHSLKPSMGIHRFEFIMDLYLASFGILALQKLMLDCRKGPWERMVGIVTHGKALREFYWKCQHFEVDQTKVPGFLGIKCVPQKVKDSTNQTFCQSISQRTFTFD